MVGSSCAGLGMHLQFPARLLVMGFVEGQEWLRFWEPQAEGSVCIPVKCSFLVLNEAAGFGSFLECKKRPDPNSRRGKPSS